jgi:hypothetical protein
MRNPHKTDQNYEIIFLENIFLFVEDSIYLHHNQLKLIIMTNEERKIELLNKMMELAEICSVNGLIGDDGQSMFIGESIKVVLMAGSEESHAELLHKHISNFLSEAEVLMNKKSLNKYLSEQVQSVN